MAVELAAAAPRRGFTPCEHPAKVRTLVGDRLLCRKCARPFCPPPWFCEKCGNSKEAQAHLPPDRRVRFRFHNGHQLCDRCAKPPPPPRLELAPLEVAPTPAVVLVSPETGGTMPRKRDRRHDNPGRPYEGTADVEFKVRLSKELGARVTEAAELAGLKLSDWWRHAAEAGLKHPPKG